MLFVLHELITVISIVFVGNLQRYIAQGIIQLRFYLPSNNFLTLKKKSGIEKSNKSFHTVIWTIWSNVSCTPNAVELNNRRKCVYLSCIAHIVFQMTSILYSSISMYVKVNCILYGGKVTLLIIYYVFYMLQFAHINAFCLCL